MENRKRDIKRVLLLTMIIVIGFVFSFTFINFDNLDNYQNNIIDNKGNSSITNEERFFACSLSSCINFASSNYVCAKGDEITAIAFVQDSNNLDTLKSFKLSNDNIIVEEKNAAIGGGKSIYEYKISCVENGTTEMEITGTNNKMAKATVLVVDEVIPVEKITIGKTRDSIYVGDSKNILVEFSPINASNKNLRWYTSDSRIVRVNQDGKILAVAPGLARITAIGWNDDEIYFESHVDVEVLSNESKPYIGFNLSNYSCVKGNTIAVKSKSCNTNIVDASTSDTKIATASSIKKELKDDCYEYTYSINCKNLGQTDLIVKSSSKQMVKVPIKVVDNQVLVKYISLGEYGLRNIKVGDSFTLSPSIYPSNATNKKIYWTSSNNKAFLVDQNGTITAVGRGRSKIKATVYQDDNNYYSDYIEFNAYESDDDITSSDLIYFNRTDGICNVGENSSITLHLSYFDTDKIKLIGQVSSVKSLNNNIVDVYEKKEQLNSCFGCTDYEIKCKKEGTAVIEATTTKGGKATYTITVK